jgi:ADP-ribosylation factor protein 1
LWRHYYQNTQVVIFVVDSNDTERLDPSDSRWENSASEALMHTLLEDALKDAVVLVFANKQDISTALPVGEISRRMNIDRLKKTHVIEIFPCCAISGDGLYEGLDWVATAYGNKKNNSTVSPKKISDSSSESTTEKQDEKSLTKEEEEAKRLENLLLEWLSREDESDELFLAKLLDYSLDTWDHRTHLRIAWIYLNQYGRREGLVRIFASIKAFIENSPRTKTASSSTRGTTFHETMTYFWSHMVHYAIVATKNPRNDFKSFLVLNPQLVNGGLFLHYYSKNLMLMNAESRESVILPDIRPLPSIISSTSTSINELSKDVNSVSMGNVKSVPEPRLPLTDTEFLNEFNDRSLKSWSHDSKIRLIYILVSSHSGGGSASNLVLDALEKFEGSGYHLTLNYFWLHMVRYCVASLSKTANPTTVQVADADVTSQDGKSTKLSFQDFIRQPQCQMLRNQMLYSKYFSPAVIDRSSVDLSFPDLKSLPNIIS